MRKTVFKYLVIPGLLAAILASTAFMAWRKSDDLESSIVGLTQQHLLFVAKSQAENLTALLENIQKHLQVLAENPDMQKIVLKHLSRREETSKEIGSYPNQLFIDALIPKTSSLFVLDANGVIYDMEPRKSELIGKSLMSEPDVRYVIGSHQATIRAIMSSKPDDRVIAITCPSFASGKFIGIGRATVKMKTLFKFLPSVQLGGKGYSYTWLIDQRGVVLSHPVERYIGMNLTRSLNELLPDNKRWQLEETIKKMMQGDEGGAIYYARLFDDQGESISRRVAAFCPVRVGENKWSLGVSIGYDQIAQPIKMHFRYNLVTVLFIGVIMVVGASGFYEIDKKSAKLAVEAQSAVALRQLNENLQNEISDRRQAEAALEREHTLLRTLIDNLPNLVWIKDAESRFVICNAAQAQRIGLKKEDLVGKTDFDFYPYESASQFYAEEQEIVKSGNPIVNKIEQSTLTSNQNRWISVTKIPIRSETGKVESIVGLISDITEQKNIEKAVERSETIYRRAIENAHGVPYQLRWSSGQYDFMGEGVQELLGIPAEEWTLESYNALIEEVIITSPQSCPELESYFKAIKTKDKLSARYSLESYAQAINQGQVEGLFQADVKIHTSQGKTKWLFDCFVPILDPKTGQAIGTLGILQDITERKLTAEALQKAHDELELRVQQRTADLAKANEELRQEVAERKKAEKSLRSMSSELSLAEERLRRRIATEIHDHVGQNLAISKIKVESLRQSAASAEMGRSLDEIRQLLAATIESTRSLTFELSPPVLYELGFEQAVDWLVRKTRQQFGISAEFHDDGCLKPLEDDVRVLLFQAVRELLVNVIKHANARNLKVSTRRMDGQICICVEDDGVGFTAVKSPCQEDEKGGFGLFSISERLNYIGGSLKIESAPGHGTRVILEAPINKTDGTGKEMST